MSIASWPAYRFLRKQVRWSGIPISLRIFHSLLWPTHSLQHSQWSRSRYFSEILLLSLWSNRCWQFDLWFLCQSSLYIWTFLVLILLKPSLKDFEHYLAGIEMKAIVVVVWAFFGIAFLGILMKTHLFQCCGHCWVFQICWHIECSTLTASPFRIRNSSSGTPSPPLALFIVVLTKAHLTLHSRLSGSRWVITPLWLSW